MTRTTAAFLFAAGLALAFGPVAAQGVRDDILIVVNDNSTDSPLVGEDYARQRDVPRTNICHVRVTAGYFFTWTEFLNLRDQMIRCMQDNTFDDPNLEPVVCTGTDSPYYCQESVDQLRQHSKIRYLVMTRGVPTRMKVDNSNLPYNGPTSADNYLKYWIVRYFTDDVPFSFTERRHAFLDGRGMRTVDVPTDGELIVSRIDGLDLDHARALVDRAKAAEATGIYGKLYGSKYGSTGGLARWYDYQNNRYVYGDASTSWRVQLGLVGEDRTACMDYLDQPASSAAGKAPDDCRARMTSGNDPPPGRASSREPNPFDGLFYLGSLDGQPTTGSFNEFRNWRKDDTCTNTLCREAADPAACQAASTDVFREIDTSCMGVADGFWGYNFQSYPVSYFTAWPTAWYQNSGSSFTSLGGGDMNRLAFPDVRDTVGRTDSYSLWFGNRDEVADPLCYATSDFSGAPTEPCPDEERMMINQRVVFTERAVDTTSPQQYRIGLWYRSEGMSPTRNLRVQLWIREVDAGSDAIDYGIQTLATVGATTDWTYAAATFTLDPALHTRGDRLYDGLRIRLDTNGVFGGFLALDDVSIQEVGDPTELAVNGSFDQGHEQVSGGDHAANFLSRLNGAAFFGSLSHHESGGHSFDNHPQETLLYFLRGLPLGDAVWWAEPHNSGILYGDPLYSPVAVRLDYFNDDDLAIDAFVPLYGSAINGRDPAQVNTTYSVDVCPGSDFHACDLDGSWTPTGVTGDSGYTEHQFLGTWDTSALAQGPWTLRLRVESSQVGSSRVQSFYDYYPVTVGLPLDEVQDLQVAKGFPVVVSWTSQDPLYGPETRYDLVTGRVGTLLATGDYSASECLAEDWPDTPFQDWRTPPPAGDAHYYLVRSQNGADRSSFGDGVGIAPDPRNDLDLGGAPCQ
ncbi:MAG: TIGR03790 family protein [Acidobacteriota bacterium]|nr:TIGR03790 family protein [Acidobacteriota bacterium]